MVYQKQIDELTKQIHDLEKMISIVRETDIIPLSFFSSSVDLLNQLKTSIYEIERIQFDRMQKHLKQTEKSVSEDLEESPTECTELVECTEKEPVVEKTITAPIPEPKETIAPKSVERVPISDNKVFLSDVIIKEKLTDFRKSLGLNERFMFQREIFQNNADKMNQALEMLNSFDNLSEALNYLNSNYPIQWESEAGTTFRELLEKRFI